MRGAHLRSEHLWRLGADGDALVLDDWRPRYRTAGGDQGLAWDSCLSDGTCWIMDCGDVDSVRLIHSTDPNGRFASSPGSDLSWRRPAPWIGAQRLIRADLDDPDDVRSIEPVGTPGGGIIAPPVHVPEYDIAVAWDSINGGLTGIDTSREELAVVWRLDVRPSMQPVVFPESGELVINDFTPDGSDDLIVFNIPTGLLIDRVSTGSRLANGMFLTPGGRNDVFYCTTGTVARVRWA